MIKFGSNAPVDVKRNKARVHALRRDVFHDGAESNKHQEYDHDVKFENIKIGVNVCRVRDEPGDAAGVVKGAILANVPITVPANTSGATMHAMKKRCDYAPQLKDIASFKIGHELIMAKFEKMETIRVDEELMDKYFVKCGGSKAERLMEALRQDKWSYDGSEKHVFAKQESLLKEHRAQPRIVYQGTDMYNAMTGPVVMELNNRMKEVFSLRNPLNTGNVTIYACGVSGEELGDVMEQARGIPIESDMSNNDGSQSAEFRKMEAMLYYKLGAPMWFVREFAKNTQVRVWTRYGVTGTVKGQRWSGETTTTTGNSYVSMALMQAALARAGVERSTNVHGGDDYLGFVEGDAEQFSAGVKHVTEASGMKAKVAVQPSRHHATFYRKRYIRGTIGCRPVPQFGRVLAKLNLRPNKNTQVNDRDYMAGKYLSAAYEHRHVPYIKDLLLATADGLSDTPYLDVGRNRLRDLGDATQIRSKTLAVDVHPVDQFSDFLEEVYGIGFDALVDTYARVAQSCLDYCDGWVKADKSGKFHNQKGNHKYNAPKLCGDTVDALVRMDVL